MKIKSALAIVLCVMGTLHAVAILAEDDLAHSQPTVRAAQVADRSEVSLSSSGSDGGGCCTCDTCCVTCDCQKMKELNDQVGKAYKVLFYDNDFSYLNDPCYDDWWLGDALKQLPVGHCGLLDIGGQVRLRYHHELGMKAPQRFEPGTDDDFLLTRVRLFGNYQVNHSLRFYLETIYADSSGERIPPRPIDENFMDFLNVFVDLKMTDALTLRVGRQELLYGAQRTISPLDWANTRRPFEGVRVLYKQDNLAVDGFYTNLVTIRPSELDEANHALKFYGMYGVYSGWEHESLDFYYIGFDLNTIGQSLHTIGARLYGENDCDWLWEIEAATQFGQRSTGVGQNGEGFVTAGVGRRWSQHCWKPTLWIYYDHASENYNQLFPLAHKYLGFIDAVQRQNVESPNVLLTMKPHEKMNLLFWFYHFQSNSAAPVPSIGGTPSQNASRYLGNELDFILNYKINARSDFLIGYSHFWRGRKINNSQDADFIYTQWQLNF